MSQKNGSGASGTIAAPLPTAKVAPASAEIKPSSDAVRKRAYEFYMERIAKGLPGDDRADWLRAERELSKR